MSPPLDVVGEADPTQIGPYEILEPVGSGGMGVVYRARHRDTGELAAVKTVELAFRKYLAGIRREIQALSRIHHPNIVRIVDSGVDDLRPWYAMELLEGPTLRHFKEALWARPEPDNSKTTLAVDPTETETLSSADRLATLLQRSIDIRVNTPSDRASRGVVTAGDAPDGLPVRRGEGGHVAGGELTAALTIARRLCDPLAFLHGEGIVHRDLKPDNVFVVDGRPILVDFGLAARFAVSGREVLEIGGRVEGTVGYMAPEQLRGEVVDARADLYALGCLLYELLTGRRPFTGTAAVSAHLSEIPVPPSFVVEGVPNGLDEIVERLLAKRPRERFGHADDVSAALDALGADTVEPTGPTPRPYLYRPGLVGRRPALQQLERHLEALTRSRPGQVFIGGPSGVGKTRLVVELARSARMRGMRVIVGECPRVDLRTEAASRTLPGAAPLAVFRPLLRAIADRCREGGPPTTRALLGSRQPVLVSYEPSLASVPHDEEWPAPPRLPTEAVRLRVLTYLGETLALFASDRPLVLIVDDLQWADELSLSFLGLLTTSFFGQFPLLVVGTFRSDEVQPALAEILELDGPDRLELDVLDDDSVRELVGEMMASPRVPEGLVAFLTRRCRGNPLFVAEYLRAALGEGLLRRDRLGRWLVAEESTSGAFEAIGLPATLGELVARRLESLSADATRVLAAAAVLGRSGPWELLAPVADLAELAALGAAEQLRLAQLLEEFEADSWRFVHDQVREGAYRRLSSEQRVNLHARAARALEDRYADSAELDAQSGTLAHHWQMAGDMDRAIVSLARAGAHALRTGAYGEAASSLQSALELDDQRPQADDAVTRQRATWHRQLGEALLATGQLVESREHLERAVALLGFPAPTRGARLTVDLMGQTLRQLTRSRRRVRRRSAALTVPERRALLEAASAYERLMGVGYFLNDTGRMFDAALRNLNLAERAGASGELARAYGSMAGIAGLIPWHRLAESYVDRALAVGAEVDEPHAMIWVHQMVACYRLGLADWESTARHFAAGRRLSHELAARRDWEQSTGGLCTLAFLRGHLEDSLARADEQLQSARRGDPQIECFGRLQRTQVLLMQGNLAEAAVELDATAPLLDKAGLGRPERLWHHALLGKLRWLQGDVGAALAAVDAAAEQIVGPPVVWYCIHPYIVCADVRLAALALGGGADKALRQAAAAAVRTVERCAKVMRPAVPAAARLSGELDWQRGRMSRAESSWRRALTQAEELRMPLELAQTHLAIGRAGGGSTEDQGRDHLRLAVDLAEGQGASSIADLARAALRQLVEK